MGAYYWEDPEIYRRLSPSSYLESIHTPTLIIHGDEDDNTSISNSREIYRALVQRGVPTQFVHYPREGHGIQEPIHRLDELRRCLGWMDRYVRHGGKKPSVYRVGDRVAHENGRYELCVTSVDVTTYIGRHEPTDSSEAGTLLEVTLTIHDREPCVAGEAITFEVASMLLKDRPDPLLATPSAAAGAGSFAPIGVPLQVPGGKVIVEGDNLRIAQRADPESGELAFGVSVVFRVPKFGNCLLYVADFPAVAVHWSADAGDNTNLSGDALDNTKNDND